MLEDENRITYFAETDFRNSKRRFGIKAKDRTKHMYIIGKTGMGKSTLLENMAAQDILNGEGMCFVDPHGSAIDTLLGYIPEHRVRDVVYFAPFDTNYPIAFNVMEDVGPDKRHLVVNGLLSSFKKIWQDAWSARMEYILSNTLLALLEYPGSTLLSVNRMLAEKKFRDEVLKSVTDSTVRAFWIDEYNKWDERYAREAAAAIQNKVGQFTANPLIRNIVGQKKSSFDIREMMDNKKILLINLSKGRIGEQNGKLLGGMLITKLYIAAMSRAEVSGENMKRLPNFYLYVDEFQNFANESFADILSEARKYKLNLTIAHQYVEQMPEEVRDAVFGNVGTMITFRIGAADAEIFEKEFSPTFTIQDIVNLGFAQIYLRLMIDGIGSKPFSAVTLPPISSPVNSYRENVIAYSRMKYAVQRDLIEDEIRDWYGSAPEGESERKENKKKTNGKGKEETIQTFTPKPVEKAKVSKKLSGLLKDLSEEKIKSRSLERRGVTKEATSENKIEKPALQKKDIKKEVVEGEKVAPAAKGVVHREKRQKPPARAPQRDKLNGNGTSNLKDVIARAMKAKTPLQNTSSQEIEDTPTPSTPRNSPKEIPADVLRKILQ